MNDIGQIPLPPVEALPELPPVMAQYQAAIEVRSLASLLDLQLQIHQRAIDANTTLDRKISAAEFMYKLSRLSQVRAVEVAKASRPLTSIVYPDGKIVAIGGSGETQTLQPTTPAAIDVTPDGSTEVDPAAYLDLARDVEALPARPEWMR